MPLFNIDTIEADQLNQSIASASFSPSLWLLLLHYTIAKLLPTNKQPTMNPMNDQYSQQSGHRVAGASSGSDSTLRDASHRSYENPSHQHQEPRLIRGMKLQRVSLDKAVSPLLPKPTAPFARSERKRAHTNAVYYSECFLRGIEPLVADTAAVQAQEAFDKWWIKSTACNNYDGKNDKKDSHKRNRADGDEESQRKSVRPHIQSDSMSLSSGPNVVSVTSSQMDYRQKDHNIHDNDTALFPPMENISTLSTTMTSKHIEGVKMQLIDNLRKSGGMVDTAEAQQAIDILRTYYSRGGIQKIDPKSLIGNWLTISKPTYSELRGTKNGQSVYTLGRISFDLFKPTGLECSIQASFNHVRPIDPKNPGRALHVPKKLMRDIRKGQALHSYDIGKNDKEDALERVSLSDRLVSHQKQTSLCSL